MWEHAAAVPQGRTGDRSDRCTEAVHEVDGGCGAGFGADPSAALAQAKPEGDKRLDVASRPEGEKDDRHAASLALSLDYGRVRSDARQRE